MLAQSGKTVRFQKIPTKSVFLILARTWSSYIKLIYFVLVPSKPGKTFIEICRTVFGVVDGGMPKKIPLWSDYITGPLGDAFIQRDLQ